MLTKNQVRIINNNYAIFENKLLGKGSTGNVFEGCQLNSAKRVAVKVIELNKIDNEVTRYLLNCEITALSSMGRLPNTVHENIVRLLDIVQQKDFIYLIMELLEGGTLMEYMKRYPNGLQFQEAQAIFRQLLQAYRYIRSKGVIHRDLKPGNILFRNRPEVNKKVVIIDFGYCEMSEVPNKPKMYYNVGSPKYMSPEAYKSNKYSEKSDVWALGVIFYQMLMGRTCDYGMNMKEYLDIAEKKGIPFHQPVAQFHRYLIANMLQFDHHSRFDCLQIIKALQQHDISLSKQNNNMIKENRHQNNQSTISLLFNSAPIKNNPVFRSMIVGQPKLQPHHERVKFAIKQISTSMNIENKKQEHPFNKNIVKFVSRLPFAINQLHPTAQGLQLTNHNHNTLDFNNQNHAFQTHQQNRLNLQNYAIPSYPNDKANQRILKPKQIIKLNPPPPRNSNLLHHKINFNIIQQGKSQLVEVVKIDTALNQNRLINNREERICTAPVHVGRYNGHLNGTSIAQKSPPKIIKRQVFCSLDKKPIAVENNSGNWFEKNIIPFNLKGLQAPLKKNGPIKNRKPGLSTPIRAEFGHLQSRPLRHPEMSKVCVNS